MGTGYHGGFGATRGSAYKKSSSDSSIPAITRVIRKQDIIDALMGVTEMSTTVAKSIAAKQIGINILGDELFDSTLDLNKVKDPKEVKGYQDGVQTYIRRSAIKGFSFFYTKEFMHMNSIIESLKRRYPLARANDVHTGMNMNIKSRKASISNTEILMKL